MRLECVRIAGFRCFASETVVRFGAFTAILGRNDVGKSSVLEALNLFFDGVAPDAGDVCVDCPDREIRVVCEFSDLPSELVLDAEHPTSLQNEFLLNSAGQLEIHKVWDGTLKAPKLKGIYVCAKHPSLPGFSDLLSLKNKELKERAQGLGVNLANVPKSVNTALRRAIWASADDLLLTDRLLSVDEESTKKVWSLLKEYLPIYALFRSDRPSTDQDSEAQDPIKVAVSEALKLQEQKLEEIRTAVEASVLDVAKLTVAKLAEIDATLATELKPTVQKPNWSSAFKIGLTDDASVPINKRGSGVRRMILLNFFRAKAERANEAAAGPGVLYAIEEPETSQHPRNQRLLLKAFLELAGQPGQQVLVTTHNPVLARQVPIDCLRLLTRGEGSLREVRSGADDVYEMAARELGVLPDNGVMAFVGVEGPNDISFLRVISRILAQEDDSGILDLGKAEDEGHLIFIPLGGSNLTHWVGRLANLRRPEFHLFDRDYEPPASPKYAEVADQIRQSRNCVAVHTDVRELENYLHPDAIRERWPELNYPGHSAFTDVPTLIAKLSVEHRGAHWHDLTEKDRTNAVTTLKRKLSTKVAELMTPQRLAGTDVGRVLRDFLVQVSTALSSNVR